jgi:AraC family transcriptional regulator
MATSSTPAPQYGSFYGQVTKRRVLPRLTLTETSYPPGYKVPVHRHPLPWLGFVVEGAMYEVFQKKTVECKPLTLLYRIGDDWHADRSGNCCSRALTVEMRDSFFNSIVQTRGMLEHSAEFGGGLLPTLMLRLYEEFSSVDDVSELAIEGLTLELIAESHRRSTMVTGEIPPVWVRRAADLVRQRFAEGLSLTEIACEINTHPVQLARAFRRYYGYSVGEYVRKLRIDYAYAELTTTDTPMVDIGLAAGFCDQAHFGRTFKKLTGRNPSELRISSRSRRSRVPTS